jgi:hypothetical protein
MIREEKIKKRKARAVARLRKNKVRRHDQRQSKMGNRPGIDCPFDVDMNGLYGTCTCDWEKYNDCVGDI